jgi:hypothetical protein
VAMTVASRFSTPASMPESHENALRTFSGFGLAPAYVTVPEDEQAQADEQH